MILEVAKMAVIAPLASIAEEMFLIEQELEKQLDSPVPIVKQIGMNTLQSGGKRLRPALLLLSAGATGHPFDRSRAVRLAACMELIHMATLIHDDVVDNASTRRGMPTAAKLAGNSASILTGDVLFAKAMNYLAEDGDLDIGRQVTQAIVQVAEGEVLEVQARDNFDLELEDHLQILKLKTASFIKCCCVIGAKLAKADEFIAQSLSEFGFNLGMAFQIMDDLLDFQGESEKMGKLAATDFREGCVTLPLIFLRNSLDRENLKIVQDSFGNNPTQNQIAQIQDWMHQYGSFDQTLKLAKEYTNKALHQLENLPDVQHKQILRENIEFVLNRAH